MTALFDDSMPRPSGLTSPTSFVMYAVQWIGWTERFEYSVATGTSSSAENFSGQELIATMTVRTSDPEQ